MSLSKMTKLLYVDYLTDCLHWVKGRPGKKAVICPVCHEWHGAVEIRKL